MCAPKGNSHALPDLVSLLPGTKVKKESEKAVSPLVLKLNLAGEEAKEGFLAGDKNGSRQNREWERKKHANRIHIAVFKTIGVRSVLAR